MSITQVATTDYFKGTFFQKLSTDGLIKILKVEDDIEIHPNVIFSCFLVYSKNSWFSQGLLKFSVDLQNFLGES